MSWEIVGWGIPGTGDAIERQSESNYWYNMEEGDRAPRDADIAMSTEVVVKVTDNHGTEAYYTIHTDPFEHLDDLDNYIEDVWVEQYE